MNKETTNIKSWVIPVTWEVCAIIRVEAETLEEAIAIAEDPDNEIPCPTDHDYVDGSWRVSDYDPDVLRDYYNNGQKDYGKSRRKR